MGKKDEREGEREQGREEDYDVLYTFLKDLRHLLKINTKNA